MNLTHNHKARIDGILKAIKNGNTITIPNSILPATRLYNDGSVYSNYAELDLNTNKIYIKGLGWMKYENESDAFVDALLQLNHSNLHYLIKIDENLNISLRIGK